MICFIKVLKNMDNVGLRLQVEFVEERNGKSEHDGCKYVDEIRFENHEQFLEGLFKTVDFSFNGFTWFVLFYRVEHIIFWNRSTFEWISSAGPDFRNEILFKSGFLESVLAYLSE